MKTKKQVKEIIQSLKCDYPEAKCSLDFNNSYQMAIAVMLSAQCTDKRVNIVTKELFKKVKTPFDMQKMSLDEVTEYIKTCGLYKQKAINLKKMADVLVNEYDGIVPNDMEKLQTLPGIGRKSANVVMLNAFHNPVGVAIDTHAKRICNRVGISSSDNPNIVEKDLLKKLDKEDYYDANHLFVYHGREVCKAQRPLCDKCSIQKYCDYYAKNNKLKNNKKDSKK